MDGILEYEFGLCGFVGLGRKQIWPKARDALIPYTRSNVLTCVWPPHTLFDPPPPPRYPARPYSNQTPLGGVNNVVVGALSALCIGIWIYRQQPNNEPGYITFRNGRVHTLRGVDASATRQINKNLVLSLANLREKRYYTLLTSSFTHFDIYHLMAGLIGILATVPTINTLYGLPAFVTIWMGSAVTGGLLQVYHMKAIETPYVVSHVIGASGAICGLLTVLACAFPDQLVSFHGLPIVAPRWLVMFGLAAWDILSWKNNWYPNIGHLCHVGGMAFGAVFWALVLRPISSSHSRRW
ncbi:uncharacterized protein PAC_05689 [Phialocephala subalpina]|uniref:Peptidase S54 rhomboid domain-containing protein n=1 Tax=Phialocephala subalpina TaxID=576137 RepID=A0A1L7WSQ4_9HELO|nr:uncharacterized protein PAC_05689 [Phialocephala subalpina]